MKKKIPSALLLEHTFPLCYLVVDDHEPDVIGSIFNEKRQLLNY